MTRERIVITVLFSILIIGVGYSLYLDIQQKRASDNFALELDKLSKQSKNLETNTNFFQNEINDLWSRISGIELNQHYSVLIDTSSKEYQRIDTPSGASFLISLKDVKPYLDGYKLTLLIGNPHSVTYKGFNLTVKWGRQFNYAAWANKPDEEWMKGYNEWGKSLKAKSVDFVNELKLGYWNKVDLILSPAKPEEFGYLEFSMEINIASFYKSE